ncbi:MAG: Mth938-like domain-containing protein [Pseudomonadota bacterium]
MPAPASLASPGMPLYGWGMRFSHEKVEGNSINGYASGQVTVNGEVITHSVVVTPDQIIHDWLPAVFEELEAAHLERLGELEPEIILIGTGATLRFPPPAWTAGYLAKGIGVEIMDTQAACRTYNVLLSEDRHVVAGLLIS